jgi:hypothetical protein
MATNMAKKIRSECVESCASWLVIRFSIAEIRVG